MSRFSESIKPEHKSLEFKYNKQDLFIKEKTLIAILGCFLVLVTMGLPKPATLFSAGIGLFALALVIFLEFTAMSYHNHSLYLHDDYIKITFKNVEMYYPWKDLVGVKEIERGLTLLFRDGNYISVLREICDYDLLVNKLASRVNIVID